MATGLSVKHHLFMLDLDNPIQNTAASRRRIFEEGVHGIIVNQNNNHWGALRAIDGQIWLLNSQRQPQQLTYDRYSCLAMAKSQSYFVSFCFSDLFGCPWVME